LVTLAYAGVHACFPLRPLRPLRLRGENALIFPLIRALVTLADAGVHSCLAVNMDFRIRENDGKGFFPLLFPVIPWQMLLLWLVFRGKCISLQQRPLSAATLITSHKSTKQGIARCFAFKGDLQKRL